MKLIELDNCFVQPHAILKISAASLYQHAAMEVVEDFSQDLRSPAIIVTLVGDEKRTIWFNTEESRDERLAQIVEEMRNS